MYNALNMSLSSSILTSFSPPSTPSESRPASRAPPSGRSHSPPAVAPLEMHARRPPHTCTGTSRASRTAAARRPPASSHNFPAASSGGTEKAACPSRRWTCARTGRCALPADGPDAVAYGRIRDQPCRMLHLIKYMSITTIRRNIS